MDPTIYCDVVWALSLRERCCCLIQTENFYQLAISYYHVLKFFIFYFLKNFCWTRVHCVGPLITPVLDFMWPSPLVLKPGCFSCLHYLLLVCDEPVGHICCYICLFHQYGCTLCVYSRLTFWTSFMQAAEGRQCWIANFGSSEAQIWGHPLNKRACYPLGHAGQLKFVLFYFIIFFVTLTTK